MLPDTLFLDEALANLGAMQASLGRVDMASAQSEVVHALFRQAHSVKGGAAAFGWHSVSELMHLFESVLEPWRSSGVPPDPQTIDLLREATHTAQQLVAAGDLVASAAQDLLDRLRNCTRGTVAERDERLLRIVARLADAERVCVTVTDLFAEFTGLGELVAISDRDDGDRILLVRTVCIDRELIDLLANRVDRDAFTVSGTDAAPGPGVGLGAASSDRPAQPLTRDSQQHRQSLFQGQASGHRPKRSVARADSHEHAERLASGLDGLRNAPASMLFSRIPPLLHQLSSRMKKQFVLKVVGGDTTIDRALLQRLVDPLVQLVRNACDHGIELPARRAKLGKPPAGQIEVSAWRESDKLRIGVRDDGAGLSRENVLLAAQKHALPMSENLDDAMVWQLVFVPGLTTATAVTEISGRGVGMDAVRRAIVALGGTVLIESTAGVGTCVTMSIPINTDPIQAVKL